MRRNVKKIAVLTLAAATVVFCCVQAARLEILNHSEETETVESLELSPDLFLDNMELDSPETVNLEECSLANLVSIIAQLERGNLPEGEIRTACQAVVYVEDRYLGLKTPATVVLNGNDYSYYSSETNQIRIGKSDPDLYDYSDLIRTVIHMNYHAYELKEIEVYNSQPDDNKDLSAMFENAEKYLEEADQIPADRCADYNVDFESDARSYAVTVVSDDYEYAIGEYWSSSSDE